MSQSEPVIPYAAAAEPKPGLQLRTILALYVILAACLSLASTTSGAHTLLTIIRNSTPTPTVLVVQWLSWGLPALNVIGGVLLLLSRRVGALMVILVALIQTLVVTPLAWSVLLGAVSTGLGVAALRVVLSVIASVAWAWLICHLALESRRALTRGCTNWPAIYQTCAVAILIAGICNMLAAASWLLRPGNPGGKLHWHWNAPALVAAVLLAAAAAGVLLGLRRANTLIILAVALWVLQPAIGFFLANASWSDLGFWLKRLDLQWLLEQFSGLPMLMLVVFLFRHPQVSVTRSPAACETPHDR